MQKAMDETIVSKYIEKIQSLLTICKPSSIEEKLFLFPDVIFASMC